MYLHRASLFLILAACTPPSVTVKPTKDAPSVASRHENCEIDFFFERDTVQRPFDVLAEVRVTPSLTMRAEYLLKEEMRLQACLLGADAVMGLHHALAGGQSIPTLVGTAVRYRP